MIGQPLLALAFFAIGDAPRYDGLHAFVRAVEAAAVPPGTTIHAGTYGANRATADAIEALPSGVYAPLLGIRQTGPGGPYDGRELPPQDLKKLDPRYGGRIPLRSAVRPLPTSDYLSWGRELGRRFRDGLRRSGGDGAPVATTWQFDEVVAEVAVGSLTVPHRLFNAGILQGLHLGRPELDDRPQKGIVWAAHATLAPLPRLPTPTGSALALLWEAIDAATGFYAGEEYVDFDGDAAAAAGRSAVGQRRLLAAGPTRRRIGHKYVVGMTPGMIVAPGLGGNVHGWAPARVNAWRDRFVEARASLTPALGFAQFNFTMQNSRPDVMRAAIEAAAAPFAT
jgi:hypothetical protein